MSSTIQNANPKKPTSVDHETESRSNNIIDQTSENSFHKTRKKRPNSLLADSKAFENVPNMSNSTSQASLHFSKNNNTLSFSSPVTDNPTESVFTMYQNSRKPEISKTLVSTHSNCALSVNDVEFIDETSQHDSRKHSRNTSRNTSRNSQNSQNSQNGQNSQNSQYSSSTSINRNNSNNRIKSHHSPELTPTTKLFPILDILVQKSSPESAKLLKVNSKASRKTLQDKLSSLPRNLCSESSSDSSSETSTDTETDINNNITTSYENPKHRENNHTVGVQMVQNVELLGTQSGMNSKKMRSSEFSKTVQSTEGNMQVQQHNISGPCNTSTHVETYSPTTFDGNLDKSDKNNKIRKTSTPRRYLLEKSSANSLEALYEPPPAAGSEGGNELEVVVVNKCATFPRQQKQKSAVVTNVWKKREDIIPSKSANTPKSKNTRKQKDYKTPEISRLKIKFTKTPQATNHASNSNHAKQPLISSFKPFQSHSRNSSLESGVTLLKFKSDHNSIGGRIATPTGTLDSALSGSHNVIFEDKDVDEAKHNRNLIVFFALICFIVGLVILAMFLLRRKNDD